MGKLGKVFVGMSGGVDSSVAALLLKNDGYDVVGVHLRSWNRGGCDVPEAEDARRVAEQIGIPFYVFDMEREYKERVVDYMVDGYRKGITPNPDVMCNKEIKFGLFLKKALAMGADYVATGHYVQLRRKDTLDSPEFALYQAKDSAKDQSYFLWTLTQEELRHTLFPIGAYTKQEVREIARNACLITAEKKDSQGVCFIGQVTLRDFLSEYLPKRRGNAVTPAGEILGTHEGAHFYTIGQRRGLGIAVNEPVYVAEKDVTTNTVVLAARGDEALYRKEVELTDVNFISREPGVGGNGEREVLARIRYRAPLAKAALSNVSTDVYRLVFKEPQMFVAPGQSAVFYSEDGEVLGGGIIQ